MNKIIGVTPESTKITMPRTMLHTTKPEVPPAPKEDLPFVITKRFPDVGVR